MGHSWGYNPDWAGSKAYVPDHCTNWTQKAATASKMSGSSGNSEFRVFSASESSWT